MNPLEIIPSEMWGEIFGKVQSPSEWLHLYRVSSAFEGTVGNKKAMVLLPQILPFVLEYLCNAGLNGMLRLRLVSKQFKKEVDNFLELTDHQVAKLCKNNYMFHNFASLSFFMETFESHQETTAIIGRWFGVNYGLAREYGDLEGEQVMQYTALTSRVLTSFGNQLREFYIEDVCFGQTECESFLNLIGGFVRLAPNLEKLVVHYSEDPDWLVVPFDENRPVSVIPMLKHFEFLGNADASMNEGFQNAILKMCCNPDSLRSASVYGVPSELVNLTNLESVEIYCICSREDRINLASAEWKLSELKLYSSYYEACAGWELFGFAQKFRNTLISLTIKIWPERTVDSFQFRIDLPHLKYLEITMGQFPFEIFRNLDSLEILVVRSQNWLHTWQAVIGFVETVRGEVERSNLWRLHNLKEIVMTASYRHVNFRRVLRRDPAVESVALPRRQNSPRIFIIIVKVSILILQFFGCLGLTPFLVLLVILKIAGL